MVSEMSNLVIVIFAFNFSTRGPPTPAVNNKKIKNEEEAEDLTKDMENPSPVPNPQEVNCTKPGTSSSKKDNELQPIKGNFPILRKIKGAVVEEKTSGNSQM